MDSNKLNDFDNDYELEFEDNFPILTTLLASGIIVTLATLLNSKSRKFLFSILKFIGKQQLNLLAGIGIFSIANFISNNISCNEDFYEEEIVLTDFNNKDYL